MLRWPRERPSKHPQDKRTRCYALRGSLRSHLRVRESLNTYLLLGLGERELAGADALGQAFGHARNGLFAVA